MSRQKIGGTKKSSQLRLTVSDGATHDVLFGFRFTRVRAIVAIVSVVVILAAAVFCLVAYTPVRTIIPGYPDANTRRTALNNAAKADSLESRIMRLQLYTENLARALEGAAPVKIDSVFDINSAFAAPAEDPVARSSKDSLLRAMVSDAEQFAVAETKSRALPVEGRHFFAPLKGVVSRGYDKVLHPYLDISAPANTVIKSVLDGTVVYSGWSDEAGYTVAIQHEGDVLSVYKHNQALLKHQGDRVSAGDPVAILGGSGSLDLGDHLHFELWYKGEALDPAIYISF